MDEATLARATEPFFTTKGIGKGTGLGLSMVDGLTGQSGGKLLVQSVIGRGTTIELWFPITTRRTGLEKAIALRPTTGYTPDGNYAFSRGR